VDAHAVVFQLDRGRQLGIANRIGVAAYGAHGSDRRKLREYALPHVAGVQDQVDSTECVEHRWAQEPVGVGNQTDEPQRRTSACSTPNWSSTRATMKST